MSIMFQGNKTRRPFRCTNAHAAELAPSAEQMGDLILITLHLYSKKVNVQTFDN